MRTTNKEVKIKIREHIKDFEIDQDQFTNYKEVSDGVQDGFFLVYYEDVKDFLNSLGINKENKEYSNAQSWELYKHLIAREYFKTNLN